MRWCGASDRSGRELPVAARRPVGRGAVGLIWLPRVSGSRVRVLAGGPSFTQGEHPTRGSGTQNRTRRLAIRRLPGQAGMPVKLECTATPWRVRKWYYKLRPPKIRLVRGLSALRGRRAGGGGLKHPALRLTESWQRGVSVRPVLGGRHHIFERAAGIGRSFAALQGPAPTATVANGKALEPSG
jgi:hypothetical protein